MFKKIICLLLISTLITTGAYGAEHNKISVYVDNDKISFDSEPYLKNGYTMVPMRAIMEALGATVSWEEVSKTATAIQNLNITKFTIDSHDYYRNGELLYMPMAAEQLNNRTYVPLRAISEGFGFKVDWDGNTSTVYISSQKKSVPEENIYYIKGKNGGYLTLSDTGITVSEEPDSNAMWALECIDSTEGIFCVYNMNNLYNPLGCCNHTGREEEQENTAVQTGQDNNKSNSSSKTDSKEQEQTENTPEPAAEQLKLCSEESHHWVIEPADDGGYRISPEGESSYLDAAAADMAEDAVLQLIPCM